MTFILAIALLGVLIFVHELGHFLVAKRVGVKVEKFSIGFGPVLFKKTVGETEYALSAIPFGGFVKMLGENPEDVEEGEEEPEPLSEEDQARTFTSKAPWKRALIVLTGPVFNIVFALLLYWVIFIVGYPTLAAEVGEVSANTPAAASGMMAGDRIVSVDGVEVEGWFSMTKLIRANPGRELEFKVEREGELMELYASPEAVQDKNIFGEPEEVGRLGVRSSGAVISIRYGPVESVGKSVDRCVEIISLTFQALGKLIQRDIPADTMGGPVMIVQMAEKRAGEGMLPFFDMMALISLSLGIFNLFPIPILDGGALVFLLIEAMRRKPMSDKVVVTAQKFGLATLLTLMLFVTYNDIVRIFSGKGLP